MTSARPVVAAFDVDGTLTTRDCVMPFLRRISGRAGLAGGLLARPLAVTSAMAGRDRDRLKALAMRAAFAGRMAATVDDVGATFAQAVHDGWLRPDTPRRLAWHRAEGHHVVLVSASIGVYLRPLGSMLGVDGVLCTEALVGDDGRYTGQMIGANCRGPEKVRRLREWMADADLVDAQLWAYGDSRGDRELLDAAHQRFLVKGIVITAAPASAS